jgi:L-lactate permease
VAWFPRGRLDTRCSPTCSTTRAWPSRWRTGSAQVGSTFLILAPIVGWIGVALSGSNTSTSALFGGFHYSTGGLLHMPPLLLPSLNSVGVEIGKPVAPAADRAVPPRRAAVRQATMTDAGGGRGARRRRLNKAGPSSYHLRGDKPDKSAARMVGSDRKMLI